MFSPFLSNWTAYDLLSLDFVVLTEALCILVLYSGIFSFFSSFSGNSNYSSKFSFLKGTTGLELLFSSTIEWNLYSFYWVSWGTVFEGPMEFLDIPVVLSFLLELNMENILNLPFILLFPLFYCSRCHVWFSLSKSMWEPSSFRGVFISFLFFFWGTEF